MLFLITNFLVCFQRCIILSPYWYGIQYFVLFSALAFKYSCKQFFLVFCLSFLEQFIIQEKQLLTFCWIMGYFPLLLVFFISQHFLCFIYFDFNCVELSLSNVLVTLLLHLQRSFSTVFDVVL